MKISPLTGAETLEQICLFVRSATRFEKAKKNVEGINGRLAVFIGKLNEKEPMNLWSL